jgi:cytochrome P450
LGADKPGRVGALDHESVGINPLEWLDEKFCSYIEDRRREPRNDVLTSLATAKYPDGSTPEVIEVVRSATFLFAAGQETTAKLLSAALHVMGERPDLQQRLRDDRSLIPGFIEESLRMESPVKCDSRLARRATRVGGVDIAPGTVVMVLPGAANRDPRRFDDPHEFRIDRKNVREHMAFARGVHSCPGGPLARVEGRVSIERILDRMTNIKIDEVKHGPAHDRRYTYEPTYILRGLSELHLTFTPND